jgi:hypothetical protein
LEGNGIVKALRIPDGQRISNSRIKPKGDISGSMLSLILFVSLRLPPKSACTGAHACLVLCMAVPLVAYEKAGAPESAACPANVAGEAQAAGAAGLVHMRVGQYRRIDAARRVEIGLISLSVYTAGEAQAAGAAGLVYIRVGEQGSVDAAKPVKEGLSEQQTQDLIASTSAQPVLSTSLQLCCHEPRPPEWSLEDHKSPCVATLTHNFQSKVACGQ